MVRKSHKAGSGANHAGKSADVTSRSRVRRDRSSNGALLRVVDPDDPLQSCEIGRSEEKPPGAETFNFSTCSSDPALGLLAFPEFPGCPTLRGGRHHRSVPETMEGWSLM